jgi:hypothetical protein
LLAISSWISVDSDEAMKRGGEALSALSLQFLSIVKRFITPIFFLAFNTSSLLICNKNIV